MGSAGFVPGADPLIDLLRDPGDLPKREIVWSLCRVSGMAWCQGMARWQAWWDELPATSDKSSEPAGTKSDGLEVAT
jgi:hypothetical protein